jgi:hypothetical protein
MPIPSNIPVQKDDLKIVFLPMPASAVAVSILFLSLDIGLPFFSCKEAVKILQTLLTTFLIS